MAVTYLAEGATSFAAANWSDATGFAASSTNVIAKRFGPVTAGLDQSAIVGGVEYLKVLPGASGDIGSAAAYFMADFDAAGTSHFLYAPDGGTLYYRPKGDTNLCTLFEAAGNGTWTVGGGGTVTTLRHSKGIGTVGPDTIVTNFESHNSAQSTIEYNATAMTTALIKGGTVYTKRVGTTTNVYAGNVTIDATAGAITTLNIIGGNVTLLSSGTITKINHYGGNIRIRPRIAITITNVDVYPEVDRAQWNISNALITHTNAVVYLGQPAGSAGVFG